jgi:CAAX protease family protein
MTGQPDRFALVASPRHTARFVAVFLGISALLAVGAMRAGASPGAMDPARSHVGQYLAMLALLWGLLWFAWRGLRARGTALRDLVGDRWRSPAGVLMTIVTAVVFLFVAQGILSMTKHGLALVGQSNAAESQRTDALLLPHGLIESALWVLLSASAGFCEEIVFRGYLQRQFSALTRNEAAGLAISALVFGLGHSYQGWRSVMVITIYGLLFGLLARVTRTLRPGILAHALQDLTSGLMRS